ncbi:hypothetical protein BGX38DRAFT_1198499 [Terfezia claveryi]|nr:hypothetical protein BGX38DRAFT_1236867 [Terfezia claveryi]KAF8444203.1 hypothetical protein BGX38DRAFT_1198499 [Terfezia claveryi]
MTRDTATTTQWISDLQSHHIHISSWSRRNRLVYSHTCVIGVCGFQVLGCEIGLGSDFNLRGLTLFSFNFLLGVGFKGWRRSASG